jgi:hypothetical protein
MGHQPALKLLLDSLALVKESGSTTPMKRDAPSSPRDALEDHVELRSFFRMQQQPRR